MVYLIKGGGRPGIAPKLSVIAVLALGLRVCVPLPAPPPVSLAVIAYQSLCFRRMWMLHRRWRHCRRGIRPASPLARQGPLIPGRCRPAPYAALPPWRVFNGSVCLSWLSRKCAGARAWYAVLRTCFVSLPSALHDVGALAVRAPSLHARAPRPCQSHCSGCTKVRLASQRAVRNRARAPCQGRIASADVWVSRTVAVAARARKSLS